MALTVIYTAQATSTGGRDGRAKVSDGSLDIKLAKPVEMGGKGDGNNPEQLFAAGYSACYIGAMKFVGSQEKIAVPDDVSVTAHVSIGARDEGGFGLKVVLDISLPGLDKASAQTIVDKAHHVCPYSNSIRGNVEVTSNIL